MQLAMWCVVVLCATPVNPSLERELGRAIVNGDLVRADELLTKTPIAELDLGAAFYLATSHRRLELMTKIVELAAANGKPVAGVIGSVDPRRGIGSATAITAVRGDLEVFERIVALAKAHHVPARTFLFGDACRGCITALSEGAKGSPKPAEGFKPAHVQILQRLLAAAVDSGELTPVREIAAGVGADWVTTSLQNRNKASLLAAFERGDVLMIQEVLTTARAAGDPTAMYKSVFESSLAGPGNKVAGIVLSHAARDPSEQLVFDLISLANAKNAPVAELIAENFYSVFRSAAGRETPAMVEKLIEVSKPYGISANTLLQAHDYGAFQASVQKGRFAVLKRLVQLAKANKEPLRAMLEAADGAVLVSAAENGAAPVLNYLLDLAKAEKVPLAPLFQAALGSSGHSDAAEELLCKLASRRKVKLGKAFCQPPEPQSVDRETDFQ